MKQMKRGLALLLCVIMLLSLAPLSALAEELETPAAQEEEDIGYVDSWDDWDDAPAEEPAPEPEEPEAVDEPETVDEPEVVDEPEAADEPEAEEDLEIAAFPANEFYYVGGSGLRVTVKAPEGAFPGDAYMTVEETKLEDAQEKIDASDVVDGVAFLAADISFANAEGKLQPQQPVEVRITSPSAEQAGEPVIVHVNDKGELEIVGELAEYAGPGAPVLTVENAADACTYRFEAKSFSEYIAVDQDPQSVFLQTVSDEPMYDGESRGTLVTVSGSYPAETDTTYVMSETEQQHFAVNYKAASTQDIVLVVECLKYGATFAALPSVSNDVTEVKKLDTNHVALRLANNAAPVDFNVSFTMTHITLTDAIAAELIDGGMQDTRIAATAYSWTGALSNDLLQETPLDQDVLWEGKPASNASPSLYLMTGRVEASGPYNNVLYEQGYYFSVSPISNSNVNYTNAMFSEAGTYSYSPKYGPFSNGALRLRMPEPYGTDGTLIEVTKIRVYEPTPLVRLARVNNRIYSHLGQKYGSDFGRSSFDWSWGRMVNNNQDVFSSLWWKVGPRTLDEATGLYYYDVKPPVDIRWFNNYYKGLSQYIGALGLTWQLAASTDPLTANTLYEAPNTVIFYKIPGGEETELPVTGPKVRTYNVVERSIKHHFNPKRALSHNNQAQSGDMTGTSQYLTDENVVIGAIYRDEWFSRIYNSNYRNITSGIEYVPANTGAITQTYEFPYQIQPRRIYLREEGQNTFNLYDDGKSTLSAITWTTWDGGSGSADQATIDAVNAALRVRATFNGNPQNYYRGGTNLLLSYNFPEGAEIRYVNVVWDQLATPYRDQHGNSYNTITTDHYTIQTSFDYKVNGKTSYTDPTQLPEYTRVHGVYTETYADGSVWSMPSNYSNQHYSASDSRNGPQTGQKYLWFRLKYEIDPDLYGQGLKGGDTNGYSGEKKWLSSGDTDDIGHLGFLVDSYGVRRDFIHDPVITLKMKYKLAAGSVALNGITPEQGVAFMTGKFTATKEASGWYFKYTTLNGGDEIKTWTIPTITADTVVQIPIDEGDYFTSIKLCFDGEADLSHASEDDTRTVIWLMKDIEIRVMDINPITGARIVTAEDYKYSDINIDGVVNYTVTGCTRIKDGEEVPTCGCWQVNGTEPHVVGQTMIRRIQTGTWPYIGSYVWSTRRSYVSVRIHEPSTANNPILHNIVQGGTATGRWDFYGATRSGPVNGGSYGPSNEAGLFVNSAGSAVYPWENIREAMYIELTDPEFVLVPGSSSIFGYTLPASGSNTVMDWEIVETQGHRFLKICFKEGFQRTKSATDGGWYIGNWNNVGYTENSSMWCDYPGSYKSLDNRSCAWGGLQLSFRSLPGTTIGVHHPIGMIYFDASGMMENYHASVNQTVDQLTGYDNDRTKYSFYRSSSYDDAMYLAADTYGLSSTTATGNKLFSWDCSAYTINVDISLQSGAELTPGKNTTYDFAPRVTTYYPTQENNLNGLLTILGPGNENSDSIYDMSTYVILPRIGTPIVWSETVELPEGGTTVEYHTQENTELDIFLRGPVQLLANADNLDYTISYTSDPNPTSASDYTYDPTAAGNSWDAVTGFVLYITEVKAQSSMNLQLDLRSDPKETIDVLHGYAGGTFVYAQEPGGALCDPLTLPLCTWVYENISIKGGYVFWDLYDENGVKTTSSNTTKQIETFIKDVQVTLYDTDGTTVIDQAVTAEIAWNASGTPSSFTLKTYKADAGQSIVIGMPTVSDGSVVKLTKKSASAANASPSDSDFVREGTDANKLVLPALTTSGLNNISAGFVKLPEISAVDLTMLIEETANPVATLIEYFRSALPSGSYNVSFGETADPSIATITTGTVVLTNADNGAKQTISNIKSDDILVTGVAVGSTTATVSVTNKLGDTVTYTYNINVTPNAFYVYHSSDKTVEKIALSDARIDSDGKFNLVDEVKSGYRYGGYYSVYGGMGSGFDATEATYAPDAGGRNWTTDTEGTAYDGGSLKVPGTTTKFWTRTAANSTTPGTELEPVADAVYFLKEVPDAYLCSRITYVYDWADNNSLVYFYLLTAVDDNLYSAVQFKVVNDGDHVARIVSSFAITQRGVDEKFINRATDFAGVPRGYIGYAAANELLEGEAGSSFTMTPQWVTLDGVLVNGTARSFRFNSFTNTGIEDITA